MNQQTNKDGQKNLFFLKILFKYPLVNVKSNMDTKIETIAKFESTLKEVESYNLEVSMIGDLNCDVGASPLDHKTQNLLDICNLYQYSQMIKQLTRKTTHAAELTCF